jgi:hypothetical protein
MLSKPFVSNHILPKHHTHLFNKHLGYAMSNERVHHLSVVYGRNCRGDHNGNHRAREESLVLASEKGYIRTVRWLMRGGADIHTENNKALRFASKNGHLEVVQFLVEGGADVCK